VNRRLAKGAALLAALLLIAGACASEGDDSSDGGGDEGANSDITACQVTDTGGVDDRSFNQTANDGLVQAEDELGVTGKVLESQSEADFEPNLNEFVGGDCDLIIPVGFLLDAATQAAAEANPDQNFAIVDCNISCSGGEDLEFDNVEELTFATDQAAFLAGYMAAGTSKSGKVGTFGGIQIPTVTIFMDGYLAGVNKYNEDNGTAVEVLGWDGDDGLFTGDFEDQDKGKQTTKSLIDEGADVVMPVAGPVGLGAVAQVQESGGDTKLIWVDTDGCSSVPDACGLFLTSVQKNMDVAVFDSIQSVVDDEFEGGLYEGTLANDGVGIPEMGDDVPAELADKIDEYRQMIIDGDLEVTS